jgi:TonB-linked SusC/RagA family outer membrane protein
MNKFNFKILIPALLTLAGLELKAQDVPKSEVTGVVRNSKGRPVQGAVISGTNKIVTGTDSLGRFTIQAAPGTQLEVSALGYQTQTIPLTALGSGITLLADADLVQVAFQKKSSKDLLGGVSYLNVPELLEKNYYLSSTEQLQSFIPGLNAGIWGGGNLTLIDGVPRDIGNVLPTEIEQVTVLKGAQAVALYGSQAARGVIMITTKKGTAEQDAFRVRVNHGVFTPKRYAQYLGSAEYMTLYNEARRNDGLAPLYNDETINNTASGVNPYRYPDVDYYSSEFLKKSYNRSDITTEFRGGSEKSRFYANLGYYRLGSLLNVGSGKDESVSRFNVRGNVDIKFNNAITGHVNSSMAFYDTKTAKGTYWANAATLRPNWYTPLIPLSMLENPDSPTWQSVKDSPFLVDGQFVLGGRQDLTTTPFGALYTQGAEKYTARQFQFDAGLNIDLRSVLKGLSFNTLFGLDYLNRFYLSENINDYSIYVADWNTSNQITRLNRFGVLDKARRDRSLVDAYQRLTTFYSAQFNYKNTFGSGHNVSAIVLMNAFLRQITEVYHGDGSANLGFQASYNFKQKYYADFTSNLVRSAKLAPGNNNAFSPVVTVGWRLSKESFLENSDVVNDLKLTASAGVLHTDLDFTQYFMYKGVYANGTNFRFNEGGPNQGTGTDITRGPNDNLGFVKRKEFNLGLDATLFNRALQLNASYFRIQMTGLPIRNTNAYPNYVSFGSTNFIPFENYDGNEYSGFDFGASVFKKVGQLGLNVGLVGTYATSKAIQRREVFQYDYQYRAGQPLDGIFGLQSDGLFLNQAQINSSPVQTFGAIKAGDIKYVDQNGDGKIDNNDVIYLGRSGTPMVLGLNLTANWKNFTLFVLTNGIFGGYGNKNNDYFRVRQERKYSEVVRDRTQINTDANGQWQVTQLGTFPRLTTSSGDNNFRDSDYWLYKRNAINLAKIQLSYDFPSNLFKGKTVKDLGVYVSGFDLFTFSKERKILETNIGSTPQTRFFNLGVKATL